MHLCMFMERQRRVTNSYRSRTLLLPLSNVFCDSPLSLHGEGERGREAETVLNQERQPILDVITIAPPRHPSEPIRRLQYLPL